MHPYPSAYYAQPIFYLPVYVVPLAVSTIPSNPEPHHSILEPGTESTLEDTNNARHIYSWERAKRAKNHHMAWSVEDDATLRSLAETGHTANEIALEFDRTATAVLHRVAYLGLKHLFSIKSRWTNAEMEQLLSLPGDSKSLIEFSKISGRTVQACQDKLARLRKQNHSISLQ